VDEYQETLQLEKELKAILTDKKRCKRFKQFLKERHCEENLLFWIDAEMYKNPESTPDSELEAKGTK
jgi:hypothetical protein